MDHVSFVCDSLHVRVRDAQSGIKHISYVIYDLTLKLPVYSHDEPATKVAKLHTEDDQHERVTERQKRVSAWHQRQLELLEVMSYSFALLKRQLTLTIVDATGPRPSTG